jgi:internalin A
LQALPSDTGLEHLKGLTQLSSLVLQHTTITGAGLKHLKVKGLAQLRTVELGLTEVTDAGVNDLQMALPNVQIER